ncbi:hypothetical protein CEXT_466051 [Caerostris extrusa]|uniref:Peptidase A2 domain-containing protein n=1 Tax=Caerostris extrusa TaxID=172846 RepID=A0AAV4XXA4_CAEEX|nr:hypothetical protein CEXT_466051 [Caerostris extrusa]
MERERLKRERQEKQLAREHELKLREFELKSKRFYPKGNTLARVNGTDKSDSEEEHLNGVGDKMSSAGFDWKIPEGETNGKFSPIDFRVGSRKLQRIIDSGAEITILRKFVIPGESLHSSRENILRPAFDFM